MYDSSKRALLKQGTMLTGCSILLSGATTVSALAGKNTENTNDVFNIKPLNEVDKKYLERAIKIAEDGTKASNGSNYPFGAVIRFEDGETFEAWNTVAKNGDPTRHAEMTLLTKIFDHGMNWKKDREKLKKATIYASAEPCFMCAGAIFWSGIGRVVYGVSAKQVDLIYKQYFPDTGNSQIPSSAMGPLAATGIEIKGPYLVKQSSGVMHRNIQNQMGTDNPFKEDQTSSTTND